MRYLKEISRPRPRPGFVSLPEAEEWVSFFRSLLELLKQLHEVLGVPIPQKEGNDD